MSLSLQGFSIRDKVIAVVVLVTAVVLSLTAVMVTVMDLATARQNLVDHVSSLARVASINSAAAVAFEDPETGLEIISVLGGEEEVVAISIRMADGTLFAEYRKSAEADDKLYEAIDEDETEEWEGRSDGGLPGARPQAVFHDGYLDVDMAISVNGRSVAYMDVQYDTSRLTRQVYRQLAVTLLMIIGGIGLAWLLASRLHRVISNPIRELSQTMGDIADQQDYSVRVGHRGSDEVGALINAFNSMLEQIENRDAELRVARDEAEAGSRAKSQFLAAMSHEIRTPMNGIIGMTELLQTTELSGRQQHFTDTVQNSALSLLNIINDILDFSKIEAGRLELDVADFDFRELVEQSVDLVAEPAARKGLELIVLIPADLPTALRGDAGRLRQVLTNLLSNAIKFTEQGQIKVVAECLKDDESELFVRLQVSDTGIGISAEAQARVFERFSQADRSSSRKYGGTGLGLAITRQLVSLMRGEVSLSSRPGVGSTFSVSLPLEKQPYGGSGEQTVYPGVKVLVVQAQGESRDALVEALNVWQMSVETCDQLLQGQRRAAEDFAVEDPFDLVFLDHRLFDDTLKEFPVASAALHAYGCAPVLLDSSGLGSKLPAGWQEGCVLSRPLARRRLKACVQQALRLDASASTELPADVTTPATDSSLGLSVLVVEDSRTNQAVAEEMLTTLGCRFVSCNDGHEALKLLDQRTFDLVLMDCQMPVMDGYEATARLRSREAEQGLKRTTVVALTAYALKGDRERALESGMDDYLSKPFRLQELETLLRRWRPAADWDRA